MEEDEVNLLGPPNPTYHINDRLSNAASPAAAAAAARVFPGVSTPQGVSTLRGVSTLGMSIETSFSSSSLSSLFTGKLSYLPPENKNGLSSSSSSSVSSLFCDSSSPPAYVVWDASAFDLNLCFEHVILPFFPLLLLLSRSLLLAFSSTYSSSSRTSSSFSSTRPVSLLDRRRLTLVVLSCLVLFLPLLLLNAFLPFFFPSLYAPTSHLPSFLLPFPPDLAVASSLQILFFFLLLPLLLSESRQGTREHPLLRWGVCTQGLLSLIFLQSHLRSWMNARLRWSTWQVLEILSLLLDLLLIWRYCFMKRRTPHRVLHPSSSSSSHTVPLVHSTASSTSHGEGGRSFLSSSLVGVTTRRRRRGHEGDAREAGGKSREGEEFLGEDEEEKVFSPYGDKQSVKNSQETRRRRRLFYTREEEEKKKREKTGDENEDASSSSFSMDEEEEKDEDLETAFVSERKKTREDGDEEEEEEEEEEECIELIPEVKASLLSRLTFSWLSSLVAKGKRQSLHYRDLFRLPSWDRSKYLGDSLDSAWREEVESKRHPAFPFTPPPPPSFSSSSSFSYETYQRYFTPHPLQRGGEEEAEKRENRMVPGGLTVDENSSSLHFPTSFQHREADINRRRRGEPSLARVLIHFYGWSCLVPAVLKAAYDLLLFVGPLMLHTIITFLGECQKSDHPEERLLEGLSYAGCLFFSNGIQSFLLHQYFHRQITLGMRIRVAVASLIYRKSLRLTPGVAVSATPLKDTSTSSLHTSTTSSSLSSKLSSSSSSSALSSDKSKKSAASSSSSSSHSNSSRGGSREVTSATSTGQIVNLMSVDAQRLQDLMAYIHILWSAPLQITIALALLFRQVGIAALGGLGVMMVGVPITGYLARRVKRLQSHIMGVRDERTKVLGEFLSSMKIIKLYAWENSFASRISCVRLRELSVLWRYQVTYILTRLQWLGMPLGVSITTFGLYVLRHGSIDPAVAFTALALFNTLGFPMQVLPLTINNTAEARVALQRIQNFLLLPELRGLSPSSSSLISGGGGLTAPVKGKISMKRTRINKSQEREKEEKEEEERGTCDGQEGEEEKKNRRKAEEREGRDGRTTSGRGGGRRRRDRKMNEDKNEKEEEEEEEEVFILPASLPRGMVPVEVRNSDVYWPGGRGTSSHSYNSNSSSSTNAGERRRLFTNLQFRCYAGTLTAIIGPTGCGKSGFLSTLLGDTLAFPSSSSSSSSSSHPSQRLLPSHNPHLSAHSLPPSTSFLSSSSSSSTSFYTPPPFTTPCVSTVGRIAYAGQEPWIQNCSLRENICFGSPFIESWYHIVVDVCSLTQDIESLPAKDFTEIGEKGVNLSGGQKQRVALARAVYVQADLYLLDDCLSAVDAQVATEIFTKCICGLLRNRTVLLITHKLHTVLPKADQILFLKDGLVFFDGTYKDIHKLPEFQAFSLREQEEEEERQHRLQKEKEEEEKERLQIPRETSTEEEGEVDRDSARCMKSVRSSVGVDVNGARNDTDDLVTKKSLHIPCQETRKKERLRSDLSSSSERRDQERCNGRPSLTKQTEGLKGEKRKEEEKKSTSEKEERQSIQGKHTYRLEEEKEKEEEEAERRKEREGEVFSSASSAPPSTHAVELTGSSSNERGSGGRSSQNRNRALGALTEEEILRHGSVGTAVYLEYIKGAGGWLKCSLVLLSLAMSNSILVLANLWLSHWSDHSSSSRKAYQKSYLSKEQDDVFLTFNLFSFLFGMRDNEEGEVSVVKGYLVYTLLAVSNLCVAMIGYTAVARSAQTAARYFHDRLLRKITDAPMGFFDATPVGRLLNRFSRDVNTIDETIPATFTMYINLFFTALATFTAISFVFPVFLLFLLPLLLFYRYVQNYYIPTSRQLQRLDSVLRSPIYQHFSETLEGTKTIRAFRQQKRFMRLCESKIDQETRAYYLYVSSNRWLALRLEFVGTSVVAFTAFCAVLASLNQNSHFTSFSTSSSSSYPHDGSFMASPRDSESTMGYPSFSYSPSAMTTTTSEGSLENEETSYSASSPFLLITMISSLLHLLSSFISGSLLQLGNFLPLGSLFSLKTATVTAGLGGLAISYALNITQQLNWLVRAASDTESNILAVERVKEYIDETPSENLEPKRPHTHSLLLSARRERREGGEQDDEAEDEAPPGFVPAGWPSEGRIELRNLVGRYKPDGPIILKGISASFRSGEKIGLVGRTGSGKSTLLLTLLRLIEPAGGKVVVDGVDTQDIPLRFLRSKFSIIPQDPILFSGTIRFNVDALGQHTDEEIWSAVQTAHLDKHILSLVMHNEEDRCELSRSSSLKKMKKMKSEGKKSLDNRLENERFLRSNTQARGGEPAKDLSGGRSRRDSSNEKEEEEGRRREGLRREIEARRKETDHVSGFCPKKMRSLKETRGYHHRSNGWSVYTGSTRTQESSWNEEEEDEYDLEEGGREEDLYYIALEDKEKELDPDEESVWNLRKKALDVLVEENGRNFSMGQRQLLCLARALLRKSKILLLDEATSVVDPLTDRLIQETIRRDFRDCTVITIAHRLETILDYDRIVVLANGEVKEFDTPLALYRQPNSLFRNFCLEAGVSPPSSSI